jgi:hypothetical protein
LPDFKITNMKKIIIIGFCILTVASVLFFGCKKGPEDPWLSFRSRKARVSGVWTVSAYTVNGIDSLNIISIPVQLDSSSCGFYTYNVKKVLNFTWTFDKTGSYDIQLDTTITKTKTFPATVKCKSITTTEPTTPPVDVKGIWDFAGGVGQFSNKEEIILTDPTDHVDDITYDMIKCSYKELIIAQSVTNPLLGVRVRQWTLNRQK